jgi:gliding motility-associated-like protein
LNYKATILAFFALLTVESFAQTPQPAFTSDVTSGCSPIIVNFTDQSTGNPSTWKWDFGNGSTSTKQNPSTSFINPGTYNVSLTVTNANGTNTITKTGYITVFVEPTAAFAANKTTNCAPAWIQFTDQSSTPAGTSISTWKWDFGDGVGTSSQQNPVYAYKLPGSYTVTLTITNDKGCSKLVTKPNYINITTGVVPEFTFTDPAVCRAPATVNFTNNTTGPGTISYTWSFGNGSFSSSQNPSAYYSVNGKYKVTLIATSDQGCTDSVIKNVDIGKVNTDFIVPASICPKTTISFLNNSSPRPIRSLWKFPNGQTDTLKNGQTVFSTSGTFPVTLINTYQTCVDTLTKMVTVMTAPVISFSVSDSTKCQPSLMVNFMNSTNGVSYQWDFGDSTFSTTANPSHTYNNFGNYDVTLIAKGSNGCADTLKKAGYIKIQKPVISFPDLPKGGCNPFTTILRADIVSADSVTSYSWNFGDGSPVSNLREPTHTYSLGTYNVSLTIVTKGGCTQTYSLNAAIKVGSLPVAAFSANTTNACADPGVQFTNSSTNATDYIWNFSDGSISTISEPLQKFKDTGWIDVTLTAINNGCENKLTKNKYIYIRPTIARFNYTPDCNNPLRYTFRDSSILAGTWLWNFGDGTTFSGQNPPVHIYATGGSYNVSLTTTGNGCSFTAVRTINIIDLTPDFYTANPEGCKSLTRVFYASSPNAGLMTKYLWDFGDGIERDNGGATYVSNTFTETGIFTIKLITVDSFGCRHPFSRSNYVKVNGPDADFSSVNSSGCKGMTVTFKDSSNTNQNIPILSWTWDFGDSTRQTYTSGPFTHTYDSVGDYDVKLVVIDSMGCSDSTSYRSFVKISTLKPKVSTADKWCPDSQMGFINETESDLPYSILWEFGDGQSSTSINSVHKYADTGIYRLKLTVEDIVGCIDSSVVQISISRPKADFTANNFTSYCTPFEARFASTSWYADTYSWDLGPGQGTSTMKNPITYYTSSNTYPVKLVITSVGGCQDSVTKNIKVYSASDATLTYSPLNGCTPREVNFNAFTSMNASFVWDFGDGNVTDTTANVLSHIYTDYGTFIPTVILKEPSKTCVVALQGTDTIRMLGVKPKFVIDSSLFCDQGTIHILDSTTTNDPALSYNWNFGDGGASNVTAPDHTYIEPGNYSVLLVVTTRNGCTDSLRKGPVKVVSTPRIDISPDSFICVNSKVSYSGVLSNTDTSIVNWKWIFPNGNTANVQNPPAQPYTVPGNYRVTVTATNSSGCRDSVSKSLVVNPLPTIALPASITKIIGMPLKLPAVYSAGVNQYTWTGPANTLDCDNCPQPVTTTKFNAKYSVAVTDSNGCSNKAEMQVIVLCKGATIFVPNTFSPNGDGVNDIFFLRGTGLDRVKSMRVFNRWGEVVFEQRDFPSNSQLYGWDGKYRGKTAQPGVYVYQVEVYCENGEVIHFEGNLSLIQ